MHWKSTMFCTLVMSEDIKIPRTRTVASKINLQDDIIITFVFEVLMILFLLTPFSTSCSNIIVQKSSAESTTHCLLTELGKYSCWFGQQVWFALSAAAEFLHISSSAQIPIFLSKQFLMHYRSFKNFIFCGLQ